jgi:hypothetical protein
MAHGPVYRGRGLADFIVPPAVWHGEASLRARRIRRPAVGRTAPQGAPAARPYTPAVRRWFCIVALLAGFSGDGYAWTARPRVPVPVERVLDPRRRERGLPEVAWWNLA